MDNAQVAHVFTEIADLLEIKGENAFKIRAYRSGADTIKAWGDPVARMDDAQLRELPGIGKDLAGKIRELTATGGCAYHQELLQEFPPTILDLLRLQGVGPKTVALLYTALNIRSVEDLLAAAAAGQLRALKGMGAKKEALILKAVEERRRDAGRHLLADTDAVASELLAYLHEHAPNVEFIRVGSLRRGCETCGDIDILAIADGPPEAIDHGPAEAGHFVREDAGDRAEGPAEAGHSVREDAGRGSEGPASAGQSVREVFIHYPKVERVLGHGDTKSSVRLWGGYQADLRLVPPASRGAAMQYFTGSKAHNIVLRDRAIQQGLKLNEYGLFRVADDSVVAGSTEEGIYEALGLAWVPPELREHRGEIEAAIERRLPRLVAEADLAGDLHMHTTETDGRDDLETMAAAAQRRGHRYIAITDHSKALAMANGLDERRALDHAARIRALNGRFGDMMLLAGIECDILADGRMDLADDCLAQLDFVVASIHSHFSQEPAQLTDRLLRAIECPYVDVIGHPTGRLLLRRDPLRFDFEQVAAAAIARGVAFEINCQVDRLDLNDAHARMVRERGGTLIISTDAHSVSALGTLRWGVQMARRAWATPDAVLNTRPVEGFRAGLRRNR